LNAFTQEVADLRSFLSGSPLFWLSATLAIYVVAERISLACRNHPLANPVLVATAVIALALVASGTSYRAYFDGAQFIHFLLGPATVALAVPLYRNFERIRHALVPMLSALVCGSIVAIATAVLVAGLLGAPRDILVSLAPKSVTTPIAMSLSEAAGGLPTLTVAFVVITGIVGAMIWTPLMTALGIRNRAAQGFAAGLASHGIGSARAFQINPVSGAFAGIALGLNGALTAVLLPVLLPWLLRLFE
jgi:predicted murein hydrolase (TIGR00659 family)